MIEKKLEEISEMTATPSSQLKFLSDAWAQVRACSWNWSFSQAGPITTHDSSWGSQDISIVAAALALGTWLLWSGRPGVVTGGAGPRLNPSAVPLHAEHVPHRQAPLCMRNGHVLLALQKVALSPAYLSTWADMHCVLGRWWTAGAS